jgi:uncharacterized protein (DUF1778 family)
MAGASTQISASISAETKELMERYVRVYGVKKSHLVEMALRHHLQVLDEIPADVLIPPVLEVSRSSGERVLDLIDNPAPPTSAMKSLYDD